MSPLQVRQSRVWATRVALGTLLAVALPLWAAPKTVSGKLRAIRGNHLTVRKSSLFGSSEVEVEVNSKTKIHGQLVQGIHVRIHYREVKASTARAGGGKPAIRRIATEIEAWPELATRSERKAAKDSAP